MTEQHTIRLTRGDSWANLKVRWRDSDGEPVPLASARLQVRPRVSSPTVLLSMTTDDDLTIVTGDYVVPSLTAEQTKDLTSGWYDLEVTSTAGQVKTLIAGRFIVDKDVTRD